MMRAQSPAYLNEQVRSNAAVQPARRFIRVMALWVGFLLAGLWPPQVGADFRQPSAAVLLGPDYLIVPDSGKVDASFPFTLSPSLLDPVRVSARLGPWGIAPDEGSILFDDIEIGGINDFQRIIGAGYPIERSIIAEPGVHTVRVSFRGPPRSGINFILSGRKLLSIPVSASPTSLEVGVNASTNVAVTLSPVPESAGNLTVKASSNKVSVSTQVPFSAGMTEVLVPIQGLSLGSTQVTVSYYWNYWRTLSIPVKVVSTQAVPVALSPALTTLAPGGESTASVTLQSAQNVDTPISLTSSPTGLLSHPPTVTIPAGALRSTFSIQALAPGSGQITAARTNSSERVTSQFSVLDQATPRVASFAPALTQIRTGTTEKLSLSLTETVNTDTTVILTSEPAGVVSVPSSVTFAAGTSQAYVPVQAQMRGTATLKAELDGSAANAAIHVTSPKLEMNALEPSVATLYNGAESDFTLKLNAAQPEAIEITLAASSGIVSVPATVTVPAGASEIVFQARSLATGTANLTATLDGKSKQATVNVVSQAPGLVSITPATVTLQPGAAGALNLATNATLPQPATISLFSEPGVQIPSSVVLPAGKTSVLIPVTGVIETPTATVAATYGGRTLTAHVSVQAAAPAISGLAPLQSSTPKGRPASFAVKLDRVPSRPQVVSLSSSAADTLAIPSSVTVPAGKDQATFIGVAEKEGQAEISATLNGTSSHASVTVTPAEVVSITLSPVEHLAYIGDRILYTARGTYTDAGQLNITEEALWTSLSESVAEIGTTGIADGLGWGQTQIGAAKDGASQQTGLTVIPTYPLALAAEKTTLAPGESASVTASSTDPLGAAITLSGGGTGSLTTPLAVTIPKGQSSATFSVTGQSSGRYTLTASAFRHSSANLDFTIVSDLEITGLNPTSAESGSVIEILGRGFDTDLTKNGVIFFGNATANVVEASATSLKVKVPPTAQTGAITLTTPTGTVSSPVFTVIRRQDFALTASPASQVLLTGGQAVYSLALSTLGAQNFTGLASLTVSGLPPGITGKFSPVNLALDQAGSLILTAASNASPGSATITIEATALVSGVPQTRTAQVTVDVQSAVGVTGVKGRIVTPEGLGIAGVRVNFDANQTITDSAGNFLLTGLPAGRVTLRMDATPAHPLYPIWPAIVTLESGKLTVLPDWAIIPPPADDKFTPINNATQDQAITDARYPGVAVTLPAGVTITGWDGVIKTRMAIERVQPDKLGVPLPPVPTKEHYQLYFGTPMGGIPSQPIPVTVPNVAELEPGAHGEIWYFDGSPMGGVGEWKLAGTGTVSEDGATISTDPGQGIPRFCGKCGLFAEACPPVPQGPPPPEPCPDGTCCDNQSPEPIEYYSGHEKPVIGGLSCGGRTPIAAGLSYSPVDAFQLRSGLEGSVGQGWVLDYDIVLAHRSSKSKRILLPPNVRIDFTAQPDGSFVAASSPAYAGAVLRLASGSSDVWELTHKDGRIWRFGQSDIGTLAASFLTEIVDPQGNATQITRRADHKITAIGTSERAHTYHYGANNLVDKITDPAGRSLSFTYNAQRRIETVTDADGGVTRYTYVDDTEYPASPVCTQGTDGLRIKTIQYPGIVTITENFHGSSRRVLKQTSRLGESRFAYTVTGACITNISDPNTVCTANCPQEDSWENYQAGWRFYGGQVIATRHIEPSGRETTRRFSAKGILLEKTDPDGTQAKQVLDSRNRVVQQTDLMGRVSKYAYDERGNVISSQDPLGRITDTQYDPKWNTPTLITRYLDDGSPVTTQIQYHATNGQPTKLIDPENRATTLAYTTKGQLQSLTDPLGQQALLSYNPAGDLIEIEDSLGNLTRLQPDGAGRTTKTTTPKGYDWQQSYNGASQPEGATDPTGGTIRRVYDDAHRLVSIWDQNGHPVETYAYDDRGNLASTTDANNQSTTYQYDAANRLIQTTSRKGEVVSYAYDSQDRIVQIARPDSTTTYGYDAAGRVVQVQEGSTRLQYDYDQADRLVREVQDTPNGFNSVEYQYDALDRRISRKVNGQDETRYTWNKANQLTQIQYKSETTTYQYDGAGRLAQKTLPGGITQTYAYDQASRLTQIQYKNGAALIDQLDLAYDAEGNITQKKLANGRLNQDSALTATYDAANRMTQITVNGKTYALAYDNNGNLTWKQNSADATDTTTYQWDSRNRLTQLTAPGINASFQYDPLSRRIERTVNGETTSYLYDGIQAIGELRAGQTTTLLTGLAIDEAIARYASTGRLTQLTDQLGSVIRQIDEAGVTQSATSYSPYGEAATTGNTQGNSTEYTGRENDGTGLYFYRARYYDPVLKRFVSEDPIGTAGGINLAGYVYGNPVKHTDPTGEIVPAIVVGAIALYTGYQWGQIGMGLIGDFLGLGEDAPSAYENVVNCSKTGQGCDKAQEDVKKLVPKTMCAVKSGADAIGNMKTPVSTYSPDGIVLDGIKNAAGGMSKLPK